MVFYYKFCAQVAARSVLSKASADCPRILCDLQTHQSSTKSKKLSFAPHDPINVKGTFI